MTIINYFYHCELNSKELFEENPDIVMVSFVSRPFLTREALQESIIKDFTTRLNRGKKGKVIEITSVKEVSPYKLFTTEELEKRLEEDEEYREYVSTWDGLEGADARFTFVQGNHHDSETDTLDIKMPPDEYIARYVVQTFDDHFVFPSSPFSENITSTLQ